MLLVLELIAVFCGIPLMCFLIGISIYNKRIDEINKAGGIEQEIIYYRDGNMKTVTKVGGKIIKL